MLPPRDSRTLKIDNIPELLCDRTPIYIYHQNLAFILRFPAHFVALFGTTSDIAKRPIVRLVFQYRAMAKPCFDRTARRWLPSVPSPQIEVSRASRLVRREDYPYHTVSRSEMLLTDAHMRAWLKRRVSRVRLLIRQRLVAYFLKITGKIEESTWMRSCLFGLQLQVCIEQGWEPVTASMPSTQHLSI